MSSYVLGRFIAPPGGGSAGFDGRTPRGAPGEQRKLIGASLIKAVFERSAYGCKLYCCWCAQDLAANYFWESMGFVPIAFRAGSTGKRRVHIFWQRRINDRDEGGGATPYWYPSQTNSGAMRADRLVFPIPPGTRWKDVRAVAVPTDGPATQPDERPALPGATRRGREVKPIAKSGPAPMGGFRFQSEAPQEPPKSPKAKNPKPAAAKIDPKFLKAARELRDRYLEHVNSNGGASLLPQGKYDVSRQLDRSVVHALPPKQIPPKQIPLLAERSAAA